MTWSRSAWQVSTGLGLARHVPAPLFYSGCRHGAPRPGWARPGWAWPGLAPLNPSWQGVARLDASPHVMAPLDMVWLDAASQGVSRQDLAGPGTARQGSAPLRRGLTRLGTARHVGARLSFPGLGTAPLFVARRVLARPVAAWQSLAGLGRARLPFKKRKRINKQLVARIREYTFGGSPVTARMLKDVHDHLLLATAALHSGDEDTAAREIKSARSLMRAAVEELRA